MFDLAPSDRDLNDAHAVFCAFSVPDPGRTALVLELASNGRWGTATIARIRGLHGVALVSSGEYAEGMQSLGLTYLESGKPQGGC